MGQGLRMCGCAAEKHYFSACAPITGDGAIVSCVLLIVAGHSDDPCYSNV